jgi:hypothetical protein
VGLFRRKQEQTIRVKIGLGSIALLVVAMSLVGLSGVAQSATVSRPGFDATVTAAVTPTKLPRSRSAPVTLTITGSSSRSESATTAFRSFAVRLDRQLAIDTEGLPTCPLSVKFLERVIPDYVSEKCGGALIGTGTLDVTLEFPEGPPNFAHARTLFLNGRAGKVLMYRYFPRHKVHFENGEVEEVGDLPGGAFAIGSGRGLTFPSPEASQFPGSKSSFQFRFGRTWRYQGRKHSYLNGQCRTGALKNRITLTLTDGTVSDAAPQRCT